MEDTFQDLLKEAYERGCPFCGPGDLLYASKQIAGRMDCGINPDGSLQDSEYEMTNEFIAEIGCEVCRFVMYTNGDWVVADGIVLQLRQKIAELEAELAEVQAELLAVS